MYCKTHHLMLCHAIVTSPQRFRAILVRVSSGVSHVPRSLHCSANIPMIFLLHTREQYKNKYTII